MPQIMLDGKNVKRAPGLTIKLPTSLHMQPVPGMSGARHGVCFVRVIDVPESLDGFMEVNPRVPSRTAKGLLAGPVAAGILETLRERPNEMVLKNQGLYLLVESASTTPQSATLSFTSPTKHGLVNGGHTYAAIREALETAQAEDMVSLSSAFIPVHVLEGVPPNLVAEIAEGLNRSRQVDNPSLVNLQGEFSAIKRALAGVKGAQSIAYHQGDEGSLYITEVLVILEMFNAQRFSDKKHPNALYNRAALGLEYFQEDVAQNRAQVSLLIKKLPGLLWLADAIRAGTPEAAKASGFRFGMVKIGGTRAGSSKSKTELPFLGTTMEYRIPNGWLYPMLSAFRALLKPDGTWVLEPNEVLKDVLPDLVAVCISEHRDKNIRPELLGKRESAYAQCYREMQLYLAKRGLLSR